MASRVLPDAPSFFTGRSPAISMLLMPTQSSQRRHSATISVSLSLPRVTLTTMALTTSAWAREATMPTESSRGESIYFTGQSMVRSLITDADAIIAGAAFDEVGRSVAGVGDLNGDGFDDILIGTDIAGGSFQGQAFLFNG